MTYSTVYIFPQTLPIHLVTEMGQAIQIDSSAQSVHCPKPSGSYQIGICLFCGLLLQQSQYELVETTSS